MVRADSSGVVEDLGAVCVLDPEEDVGAACVLDPDEKGPAVKKSSREAGAKAKAKAKAGAKSQAKAVAKGKCKAARPLKAPGALGCGKCRYSPKGCGRCRKRFAAAETQAQEIS
eukprot:8854790-Lingulodinium_polyedra.AAC.1